MNKKGQTLIIFVILIPIIILILAVIVDTGLMINENIRANNVIDTALKESFKKNDESIIEDLLNKNNIPTDTLSISKNNQEIKLKLDYKIHSIFGKIIRIDDYEIKIKKKMVYDKDIIKIIKE